MQALLPAGILVVVIAQVVTAGWLFRRAKGRLLLVRQAQLLALMAAFLMTVAGIRMGGVPRLATTLEDLYAVLSTGLLFGYVRLAAAWANPSPGPRVYRSIALLPVVGVVTLAALIYANVVWGARWFGLPWNAAWMALLSVPALFVAIVFAMPRFRRIDPNTLFREGPWLLLTLWVGIRMLVWSLGEGDQTSDWLLGIEIPFVVAWAWAADRATLFSLAVENVGTDSVRALHESLFLLSPRGTVDYANPAAIGLLGRDPTSVAFKAICPEWPCVGRTVLRRNDGVAIPVVVSRAPLVLNGEFAGDAVSATDVTELQRAVDEANAARELANEAARARQEFVAVMSHEIRTPMNAIVGLAHLLSDSRLEPEQAGWVGTIRQSADSLLVMLTDILDFSRIESGRMDVEQVPMRPVEVLQGAAALVENVAARQGLTFTVDVERLPDWVLGDPTRIRQIVLNLLSNAMKFTPYGRVQLYAAYRDGCLTVDVVDTGIGIPADRIESLFEAFRQADVSMTRRFGGTGLGLTISRRLAELMGGTLGVQSRVGTGSTFTLRLPAPVVTAPLVVQASPSDVSRLRQLRVLVVEDNPVNRLVLRAVLGRIGIRPDEAKNGLEGVDAVLNGDYDVVFMDLQMPVLDGWQALARITEALGDKRPLLVSHSANVDTADNERARACGAHSHLPKPASPSAVEAMLRRCLVEVR